MEFEYCNSVSNLDPIAMLTEPRQENNWHLGFRLGPTQTGLYIHRRRSESGKFGIGKQRDCTNYVAKTKELISCAVTAQLICAFVFAYANSRFSYDAA